MAKKKKQEKSVLMTAAESIGKAAGKIASVVSETAEKAKALADRGSTKPAKKARKPAKKKTVLKKAVLPKIKKLVRKSK